jgi:ABC-type methionine transport system permease subunit
MSVCKFVLMGVSMKNTYIFIAFSLFFFILPGILLLINKKKSAAKNQAFIQKIQQLFIVLNVPAFFVISFVIFFSPFLILGLSNGPGAHIGLLFATVAALVLSTVFVATSWSESSNEWISKAFPKLTHYYNILLSHQFAGLIPRKS